MKKIALLLTLLLTASAPLAFAAHDDSAADKSAAPADAAWLAKAKAEYPLEKCVVSDEEIGGDMGQGIDYIYKQKGKPDRLVRFCCKDCVADFTRDPAKYLMEIDAAADAKAKKK